MHPILLELGIIKIYSYGFLIAVGFLTAIFFILQKCKKKQIDTQLIVDLGICLLLSGIIGARLLHVLSNFSFYSAHPVEIIMLPHGGLAYQGGLVGAVICGWFFLRKRNIDFLDIADLFIPYLALAQAIGRIGCFFNGCCYGRFTQSVFGIKFPHLPAAVYPTQIYYSFCWMLVFIFLNIRYEKRNFKGEIFCLYFLCYGLIRFMIDFLRGDLNRISIGLSLTQIISLLFVVFAIFLYGRLRKSAEKKI
jgi:phosphatidylglycerol:prolipoprotein diacylglycerol transferase